MRYNIGTMREKIKIYVDTSVINFALADDISEEVREVTKELCRRINDGKYEGYISEVVLRELNDTQNTTKKKQLLEFVQSIEWDGILEVNKEVDDLTTKYISEKIFTEVHRDDALHVALTTVNDIDILATWNFKHIVRHKTRVEVAGINAYMGYRNIDICTPQEVREDV